MVDGCSSKVESMSRSNFENLTIYKLAEALADQVWTIVVDWEPFARDTVGGQLVRAADSIGANIAEGVGRWGLKDQKRFIYIARGSLNETKHWLRRCFRRKLLSEQQIDTLKPILEELPPKLNAYINSLGGKKRDLPPSASDDPSSEDE